MRPELGDRSPAERAGEKAAEGVHFLLKVFSEISLES